MVNGQAEVLRKVSAMQNLTDEHRTDNSAQPIPYAGGEKPPVLVLLGPTAVGKTELSLQIARAFDAEIISGDSMQVYRGMDIGTAKITKAEMQGIPHHLIDIVDPTQDYSVADFQEMAAKLIRDIHARGQLPFIVGGTGLYIESLLYRFAFSDVAADPAYRHELEEVAAREGVEAVHAQLAAVDPESAARLHPNNLRRVIRALEIYAVSGQRLSAQLAAQTHESPYQPCIIGLMRDRAELYARIDLRVDLMMQAGLLGEVENLLRLGLNPANTALQGIGYKELIGYLHGETSLLVATERIKRNSRRYAKRQMSWFRHMHDIIWQDATHLASAELFLAASEIVRRKFDYLS
jgi:tRNA dimethylallyltransferase